MARVLFTTSLCLMVAGCMSQKVELYPVQGPLSKQVPLPVLHATANGVENNTGSINATLSGGEVCQGKWSSVAPTFGAVTTGSLIGRYGTILGSSVTTGIVPGTNKGQAFLSCSRGTTMEAEFYTGSGTANGFGIAKDSKGNVYKMLF